MNLIGELPGRLAGQDLCRASSRARQHADDRRGAIDFHAGEPVIHAALRWLAPGDNLAFYRGLVAAAGGVLRGEHMLAGFIAIKPDNEIARQMQLLANLDDRPTWSGTASSRTGSSTRRRSPAPSISGSSSTSSATTS